MAFSGIVFSVSLSLFEQVDNYSLRRRKSSLLPRLVEEDVDGKQARKEEMHIHLIDQGREINDQSTDYLSYLPFTSVSRRPSTRLA